MIKQRSKDNGKTGMKDRPETRQNHPSEALKILSPCQAHSRFMVEICTNKLISKSGPHIRCRHQKVSNCSQEGNTLAEIRLQSVLEILWSRTRMALLTLTQVEKQLKQDFPGGPVVKNPLCNAGDMGSIPGEGIKLLDATELLSPDSPCTITEDSPPQRNKDPGCRN